MSTLIPDLTKIPAPRTPLIDERTGLMSREWYRFFYNLYNLAGTGGNFVSLEDIQKGPPSVPFEALQVDPNAPTNAPTDSPLVSQVDEIDKQINALESQPECPCEEYNAETQKEIDGLELLPRAELGTMAALQQANVPWLTFDTTASGVPPDVGTVAWDGGTTLGIQMTPNVLLKVGEAEYIYAKASSAITKGQVCYHTGAVGSSGVTTVAPAPIGLTDPNEIVGIAAESIALNDFGLIQISGDIKGFDTTGSSVGETWADGDSLYYNPAFVGSMTNIKPVAPNQKTYMGEVINAGSGGSGSMHIRISQGSVLGGTDSNVQFGTVNNGDLIQYDSALQYWKNVAPSSILIGTATNLAGGLAGSVPYQTAPGTTTFLNIGTALQVLKVNAGATAPEWVSGAALTKVDDTNVTLTLGGTPATSLLAATSLTLGWAGQLAVSRGGTGVSTATANTVFSGPTTGAAAAPSFRSLVAADIPALSYVSSVGATAPITSTGGLTPTIGVTSAALTKVDDTNVTLTLGGSPTTALLAATSLTLGWTGQLGLTRGGTNASLTASAGSVVYSTASALALNTAGNSGDWLRSAGTAAPVWTAPAALTKTDDTNVTLTLGGTPATSLLAATSLTLGWTGQLAVSRGGTGTGTAFTTGSVVFAGASGTYSQNNANFFWDNTNTRLGVGTNSPSNSLTIGGNVGGIDFSGWNNARVVLKQQFNASYFQQIVLDAAGRDFRIQSNSADSTAKITFWTGTSGTTTERMRIDAAGNVGIGTVSPFGKLDVNGITGAGTNSFLIGFGANGDNYYTSGSSGIHVFRMAATERMRLDNAGNLGLGTASPAYRLDVQAGVADFAARILNGGVSFSRQGLLLQGGNNTEFYGISARTADASCEFGFRIRAGSLPAVWASTNHPIIFGTNNTEKARLDASGNFGVGTAAPVNKLQVAGSFGRGAPVTKTGNFTLADTENWVICNGTGTITVTLPTASSWTGREFTIKTIAAFTVISDASNVVPLAGGAAGTAILAATAGTWATLVSDGTNWIIMQA